MMILIENIYQAWKQGKVFTAIYLDVAEAFNNVHHKLLIHNLRARHIPECITKWLESFLKDRSTRLRFIGGTSEAIPTPADIPQGSPLSPLLYMYYNAGLLEISEGKDNTIGLGFLDDIVYGVDGATDKGNAWRIREILQQAEEWRRKHGVQFETSKYALVHYTRNYNRTTGAKVTINGIQIHATNEAKYLGVIFDKQLRFTSHMARIIKKDTTAALALSGITKCTRRALFQYVHQLFQVVIASKVNYRAIIWDRL